MDDVRRAPELYTFDDGIMEYFERTKAKGGSVDHILRSPQQYELELARLKCKIAEDNHKLVTDQLNMLSRAVAEKLTLDALASTNGVNDLGHTYVSKSGKVLPCTSAEKRRLAIPAESVRWLLAKQEQQSKWYWKAWYKFKKWWGS